MGEGGLQFYRSQVYVVTMTAASRAVITHFVALRIEGTVVLWVNRIIFFDSGATDMLITPHE